MHTHSDNLFHSLSWELPRRDALRTIRCGLALVIALVTTCGLVSTRADADITVVKHHNAIDAHAQYDYVTSHRGRTIVDHSNASDALTSYNGHVSASLSPAFASADLTSTISSNSLSISGGIQADRLYYSQAFGSIQEWTSSASANTMLQFTVTATGYYNVSASSGNATGSVKLLASGVVVFQTSGTVSARYLFTVGSVYEIDASATVSMSSSYRSGSYGITVLPSN